MQIIQSRRRFLAGLSLASAAALVGAPKSLHAEPPPETTTVRFARGNSLCMLPQFVAKDLLRAEGFTDIRYVDMGPSWMHFGRGQVDFGLGFSAQLVQWADAGEAITVLAGVHPGCFQVFGTDRIHGIVDLKGKSVGVRAMGSTPHVFLSVMASYVGLDPATDINWVTNPKARPLDLFVDGKIDAFVGFPPDPQEMHARHIGHVIADSSIDRPWSQYFCCMLAGDTDYIHQHPIATKRVMRAILKATDFCTTEPKVVAQRVVDDKITDRYDYALQTLADVPYGKWREYNPEDTIRFYALRLRELGMVKSAPQEIIANNTDWRLLNELKRELKG